MMCAEHRQFRASWVCRVDNVLILACGACWLALKNNGLDQQDTRRVPPVFQRAVPFTPEAG